MGPFDIIVADPPWKYADRSNLGTRFGGGSNRHYEPMTTEEICTMQVAGQSVSEIAADRCVLFLWMVWPMMADALKVIDAWGFKYSTSGFVWVKGADMPVCPPQSRALRWPPRGRPAFKTGYYTKSNTEVALLAQRGGGIKPAVDTISELIIQPPLEHSQKPAEAMWRIEQMYPDTHRIELFSRKNRDGWVCWGNEAGAREGMF